MDSNGDGFFELGSFAGVAVRNAFGFVSLIDLDAILVGFPKNSLLFDAVQIVDDKRRGSTSGDTVGMDLESVGALTSLEPGIVGDFNNDGTLDANDIDVLSSEVRAQTNQIAFDVNHDAKVDSSDRQLWVIGLRKTWFGDASLDGRFDSGDLVRVFQAGEYEDTRSNNSLWSTGDWNGDSEFTTSDLVTAFQDGGYEQGPRSIAATTVPEPSGLMFCVFGFLGLTRRRNVRSSVSHDRSTTA